MKYRYIMAAAALVATTYLQAAHADVVSVSVHGNVSDTERRAIVERVFAAGRAASWEMKEVQFSDEEIIPCFDRLEDSNECITPAAKARGVAHLVAVRVVREKRDVTVAELFLTPGTRDYAHERELCARCRGTEWLAIVTRLADYMIEKTYASVSLAAAVSGRALTIHDKAVDVGDKVALSPGTYRVRFAAPGYQTEVQDITVQAGRATQVITNSTRIDVAPTPRPRESSKGTLTRDILLVSASVSGIAGVAAGTGLVVAAQTKQDADKHFTATGIGVGLAGVAVFGIALFWIDRAVTSDSLPVVQATSHGATVGWTRSF